MQKIRTDWTIEEIGALYHKPLMEVISEANAIHGLCHNRLEVQVCTLISIKTGGCPEDCKYCAQSSRYQTSISASPLMKHEEVMQIAKEAVEKGCTRICLGAAWREVRDSEQFERVLSMVEGICSMGVEVCCTLGMLKEHQAQRLKKAGLYAYNHNLDTSAKHYPKVISTRIFSDRLKTLDLVEEAGLSVCCGGILGLGEETQDRIALLHTLATRDPHPESVPVNILSPIPGTPFEGQPQVSIWEMLRFIATARVLMPKAMIRLSAGRLQMLLEQQSLCFLAGANSIFSGEKLLTVDNPGFDADSEMFELFGLKKRAPYAC